MASTASLFPQPPSPVILQQRRVDVLPPINNDASAVRSLQCVTNLQGKLHCILLGERTSCNGARHRRRNDTAPSGQADFLSLVRAAWRRRQA